MIFRQWKQVLDGTKTQTRRLVKPDERCRDGITVSKHWISRFTFMPPAGEDLLRWTFMNPKWQVYHTYTVQPGRGKKAVGRICITGIRRERLQLISDEDAEAEGICLKHNRSGDCGWSNGLDDLLYPRREWAFKALWNSINKKPGTRWADNPEVWVLEFEAAQ